MKTNKTSDLIAKRLSDEIQALRVIFKFHWILYEDLELYLYGRLHESDNVFKNLIARLLSKFLILKRRLPRGRGTVFVLSYGGAGRLNAIGINAENGDRIGCKYRVNDWIPNMGWETDLAAKSLMVMYRDLNKGCDIYTKREVMEMDQSLESYPAGLIKNADNSLIWLEVERPEKSRRQLDEEVIRFLNIYRHGINIIGLKCHRVAHIIPAPLEMTFVDFIDYKEILASAARKILQPREVFVMDFFTFTLSQEYVRGYEVNRSLNSKGSMNGIETASFNIFLNEDHKPFNRVRFDGYSRDDHYKLVFLDVYRLWKYWDGDPQVPVFESWPEELKKKIESRLMNNGDRWPYAQVPRVAFKVKYVIEKDLFGRKKEYIKKEISFIDGRHRTLYLKHAGAIKIPVWVHRSQADDLVYYCGYV